MRMVRTCCVCLLFLQQSYVCIVSGLWDGEGHKAKRDMVEAIYTEGNLRDLGACRLNA